MVNFKGAKGGGDTEEREGHIEVFNHRTRFIRLTYLVESDRSILSRAFRRVYLFNCISL
jgi:hypothetical protein